MNTTAITSPALDVDALLALHRSVFGNARMEESSEGGAEGEGGNEGSSESGSTEGSEGSEGSSSSTEDETEDKLPEWARKELTKVRGEAANYRTKLRDTEKRLETAKTPEEFEAATSELREVNATLERTVLVTNVARKFNLPDELADRLRGSTAEELEADAKALQKFAATEPPASLSGGLDPNSQDDEPDDPASLAKKYGRGVKR